MDYRFTALVVDQVDAVDGRYEVLFLGTGEQNFSSWDCMGIGHWSQSFSSPPRLGLELKLHNAGLLSANNPTQLQGSQTRLADLGLIYKKKQRIKTSSSQEEVSKRINK